MPQLVKIKTKYQVTLPASLREQMGVDVGDILEAKVEEGKITMPPKSLIDRDIAEGLEDIRQGRIYGPFDTAEEMIRSLRALSNKKLRTKKAKGR
ncbi:MAG: AbrB/MazE/SpoVT family DNA-binding domain-containing protein [Parcubacteria group bacterium]|nr:AbrB/MazE/SpoVT family DNA-binding domain-containing protein [Parcubacteria group bacterium]